MQLVLCPPLLPPGGAAASLVRQQAKHWAPAVFKTTKMKQDDMRLLQLNVFPVALVTLTTNYRD